MMRSDKKGRSFGQSRRNYLCVLKGYLGSGREGFVGIVVEHRNWNSALILTLE